MYCSSKTPADKRDWRNDIDKEARTRSPAVVPTAWCGPVLAMLPLALAALLLAALASAQLDVTVLEQLSEADYPLAKCNDGTQVTVCLSAVSLCCVIALGD